MAPEFFPFIAFGVLAFVVAVGLAIGAVSFILALYFRKRGGDHWARRLVALGWASLAGVIVASVALFFVGNGIRQQYFLNEPFVIACGNGDIARAEQLLARGASPDAYGIDFINTALIAASSTGHRDIVALLLRSGAHVYLKDIDGKTAVERARENGHHEIAQMLDEAKLRR